MKLHKRALNIALIAAAIFATSCNNAEQMRIMSYNVRHCRGMDNVIDYDRIAEVINRAKPEVVALQELDSATKRSNGKVCIDELARATGMNASYASAIKFGGGSYGIGLLSKQQPLATKVVELESRGEARRLLVVEFEKYVVCSTHFPLNAEDREASVKIICDALQEYSKPLFLAGDMNCHSTSPEQSELIQKFTVLNNPCEGTYPSINPEECIDFIYSLNNEHIYKVRENKVLDADSIASDHLPLYVDVEYK